MARVLVLGGSGMLGHKLCQVLAREHDLYATFRSTHDPAAAAVEGSRALTGVAADNPDTVTRAVARSSPDVVVNCIGIVKQAAEAQDPLPSISINALFPHRVADLCAASGARLVHVSTDCVFSGREGRYTEDHVADAEDLYGRTKLLGEVDYGDAITLRTSIIGPELGGARGLFEWFRSQRGGRVRGFTRAIFSGLTTVALSRTIHDLITQHPALRGVYHVAAEPISKFDLLTQLNDAFGLGVEIEPDDSLTIDRSLDDTRFRAATGTAAPSWPAMIRELVEDSAYTLRPSA